MLNSDILVVDDKGLQKFPPQEQWIQTLNHELTIKAKIRGTGDLRKYNQISRLILEGGYVYPIFDFLAMETCNKIVRWNRSEFPLGCELVDDITYDDGWDSAKNGPPVEEKWYGELSHLGIVNMTFRNDTYFLQVRSKNGPAPDSDLLFIRKDRKTCKYLPLEFRGNHVQVNDDICAILDKDSEFPDCIDREDQTFTTGKLYFWNATDPEPEAFFSVTSVSQFVLMGREVVYSRGDNLMARKDDKSERVLVEKLPSAYVKKMLISKEQDLLYLIFRENSLVTYELPEGKEMNRVPAPGLLRSVQLYGGHIIGINKDNHLVIIDPQKGLIKELDDYQLLEIEHICDGKILVKTAEMSIVQIYPTSRDENLVLKSNNRMHSSTKK